MSWIGLWLRGRGKTGRGQDDTEMGQAQPRDIFLLNRVERTDEIENTGAKGTGKYIEFADIARNNQVLYADGVAHIQNYDFEAKVHGYILSGITYENPITAFTLGAAHSTESRIDVVAGTFGLDGVGKIIIIPGAGIVGTPVKPELTNYDTQIELTFITVGASTTEPDQVTDLLIYDENVEFTTADNTGGARVDFDDETSPYVNSKDIQCVDFAHGDQMTFTQGSVFNVYDYKNFQLQIERITTKWVKNATLEVAYYDTGTSLVVSSWVKIGSDSKSKLNYKFDSAIDGYQNVLIPTTAFVFTSSTADRIIIRKNDNKGTVSFRLDLIKFQVGISEPPVISNPHASDVIFDPYLTLGSNNVQSVIEELKDEVDVISTASSPGVENRYADIAALLADQGNQLDQGIQRVLDASTDATVDSGYAYYEKLTASTSAIGDYRKLTEEESMDVAAETAAETSFTPYGTIGSTDVQAAIEELKDEVDVVTAIENRYADIAALLAGQGDQTDQAIQQVLDASTDTTIGSGFAYYEKLTASTAAIGDYRLVSCQESIESRQREVTNTDSSVRADNKKAIILNKSTAFNFTIDNNLPTNGFIEFYNKGVGTVSFVAGTASLTSDDGLDIARYKVATIFKIGSGNEYVLKGELV